MSIVSSNSNVNLNASGDDLILQNGANILRTLQGECGLLREMGINGDFIDKPIHKIEAKLYKNIVEQFAKYEPRLKIKEIEFIKEIDVLRPVLEVEIIG